MTDEQQNHDQDAEPTLNAPEPGRPDGVGEASEDGADTRDEHGAPSDAPGKGGPTPAS